jgi:hypothetical protein
LLVAVREQKLFLLHDLGYCDNNKRRESAQIRRYYDYISCRISAYVPNKGKLIIRAALSCAHAQPPSALCRPNGKVYIAGISCGCERAIRRKDREAAQIQPEGSISASEDSEN